jgi:hypothetical protein
MSDLHLLSYKVSIYVTYEHMAMPLWLALCASRMPTASDQADHVVIRFAKFDFTFWIRQYGAQGVR